MPEKEIFESVTESSLTKVEEKNESNRNQELWSPNDSEATENIDNSDESSEGKCEQEDSDSDVDLAATEGEKLWEATSENWSERGAHSLYQEATELSNDADGILENVEAVGQWIATAGEAVSGIGEALQGNWTEGFGEKSEIKAEQKSDFFGHGNDATFEMLEAASGETLEMVGQAGGDYLGTVLSATGEIVSGAGETISVIAEGLQTAQDCSVAEGVDQIIDGVSDAAGNSLSGALSAAGKGAAKAAVEVGKGIDEIKREIYQSR